MRLEYELPDHNKWPAIHLVKFKTSTTLTSGVLVLDESDRARSKNTTRIHKTHKQKHKASGGYVNGQTIVLLLLVTDSITVPVGFKFYMPDPAISAWNKEEQKRKKKGKKKELLRVIGLPNQRMTLVTQKKLNWRCYCSRNSKNVIQK